MCLYYCMHLCVYTYIYIYIYPEVLKSRTALILRAGSYLNYHKLLNYRKLLYYRICIVIYDLHIVLTHSYNNC